ncbi:MAG: hypothetical protein AAB071_06370 [Bacteroidota bacterium]
MFRSVFSIVLSLVVALNFSFTQTQKRTIPSFPAHTRNSFFSHVNFGVSAGLGISLFNSPDLVDYLNTHGVSNTVGEFQSAPEFFTALEIPLSENYGVKLEYAHLFTTYILYTPYQSDEEYTVKMPMLLVQKLFPDSITMVKLGVGAGYHFVTFDETIFGNTTRYTTEGVGFKGEMEINAALSEALFAYIAGDVRFDFFQTLRSTHRVTYPIPYGNTLFRNPTFSFIALGLKLGVIVYL